MQTSQGQAYIVHVVHFLVPFTWESECESEAQITPSRDKRGCGSQAFLHAAARLPLADGDGGIHSSVVPCCGSSGDPVVGTMASMDAHERVKRVYQENRGKIGQHLTKASHILCAVARHDIDLEAEGSTQEGYLWVKARKVSKLNSHVLRTMLFP